MQIKLSTARDYLPNLREIDLFDPQINIYVGTLHYAACLKQTNDMIKAVDLYNRGIVLYKKYPTNHKRSHIIRFKEAYNKYK